MKSIGELRFGKELYKLTINDIQLLIDNKIDESQNLDYKQPSGDSHIDCNNMAEVISSFLNTTGGLIIYGVAESKEGERRLASKIMWSKLTKETIENFLISKVQPWSQEIKIQRIANKENVLEGIYVIDVPKSTNPPRMYLPENIYYQRLNFQNKRMNHESIFRAFQTSSIRRRDIITQVIQPLYSEIKSDNECIRDYKGALTAKYDFIIENRRFLYDLLEKEIRRKIDEFYDRLRKHQYILTDVYRCTTLLINEELCKTLPNLRISIEQHVNESNLEINLSLKDKSGNIQTAKSIQIRDPLLKRGSLKKYLQSLYPFDEIIEIVPIIMFPRHKLSIEELKEFWEGCKSNTKQNGLYLLMWKERKELLELSKNILKDLSR